MIPHGDIISKIQTVGRLQKKGSSIFNKKVKSEKKRDRNVYVKSFRRLSQMSRHELWTQLGKHLNSDSISDSINYLYFIFSFKILLKLYFLKESCPLKIGT